MPHVEVIVSNIGTVYSGYNAVNALDTYQLYQSLSAHNDGRAGGETVTLWQDGKPIDEYNPVEDNSRSFRNQLV